MERTTTGLRQGRALAVLMACLAVLASPPVLAAKSNTRGNAWGSIKGGPSSTSGGKCSTTPAPPVISGSPSLSATEGQAYSFTPSASDPNCDSLTFSIAGRPWWASFNAGDGSLAGTPPIGSAATYAGIVITVSDGSYKTSLPTFSITVGVNHAPKIGGQPAGHVTAGQTYTFVPTASDADGDTLKFSVANLPPWASFTSATGKLSGTPSTSAAGEYIDISISVSDGQTSATLGPFSIVVDVANSAPTISGAAPTSVTVGQVYRFVPQAADVDGDNLSFRITNRPAWASFNTATGELSGTPAAGDAGTYSNIQISVSDGQLAASLPAFSIAVDQVSTGSATLSWQPPTQRTDGSALSDLAGYRILYGASPGSYSSRITLNNAGLTTYVVENLGKGTWYFVMTAFDSTGAESDYSAVGSKTVQ